MKKKFYVTAIFLVLTAILFSAVGCSLFSDSPQRYYIEIGQVEDSRVASIVANNTISSCVRISAEFPSISLTSKSSGFFVTSDGYVITNRHCVIRFTNGKDLPSQNGELPIRAEYSIIDTNGNTYNANLVAYSKSADIALLQIVPHGIDVILGKEFEPLVFDTVSKPYYGDRLYTIGNPEDMGFIFSELMVASPAVKLSSEDTYSSIVLDGNINHGNSGGPLIDVNSHVVGLIFARVEGSSTTDSSSKTYGLGCAIPAEAVTAFLDSCGVKYLSYTPQTNEDTDQA
ncbi:MAG: serine protease [Clostridia bacterium]|nr:serine protease [Clostridia bacterium]MDE6758605.1 serine protease [Clostridia bacterium]